MFPNFYAVLDAARWTGRRVWPFLLGLTFLLLLAFVIANARAGQALEAELQKVRAEGAPLSLREAAPLPVPEDENAALVYEQAFQRLPRLEKMPAADVPGQQRLAHEDEQVIEGFVSNDGRRQKRVSLRQVRQALAGTEAALALVRKAAAMQRCRFAVDWEAGASALLPHLPRLRTLSQLLAARAVLEAVDRKPSEAAIDIEAMLGIARHIRAEPILIGQLVGYSCLSMAASSERRLLEIAPPSEAECRRLDQMWAEAELYGPFERTLQTERCLGLWAFDLIRDDPKRLAPVLGTDAPFLLLPGQLGPLGQWLRKLDEIGYLRSIGEEIASEKRFHEAGMPDPLGDRPSFAWYAPVTYCLMPAFAAARRKRDVTVATIALARWGLAIEVYRQRTGRFPETLRDIEGSLGWRLPADPFTAGDLRYRRLGSRYLLYSLGANRRDDGGQNWHDKVHTAAGPLSESQDDIAWWFN